MLGNPLLLSDDGYNISRSVRLRSSASAYFNRTPASAGNRQTWTWSGWVKLGALVDETFVSLGTTLGVNLRYASGALQSNILTVGSTTSTAVYRDPSAWYHIVIAVDTTQASNNSRLRLYVNGSEVAYSANATITQNANLGANSTTLHTLGVDSRAGSVTAGTYFDGYLTEVNFIDGQALTPSSFGETDAVTGVWKPKKFAGTYGTNGFYLNFSDNSNNTATTIGKDYSGNGNNWTPNNISVTTGSTYDSMLDVPTPYADGGNGRGNYAVMNPLNTYGATLTNGNLQTATTNTSNDATNHSTIGVISGKWYAEFTLGGSSSTSTSVCVGVSAANSQTTFNRVGQFTNGVAYLMSGSKEVLGSGQTAYGSSYTYGDIIGVALDLDASPPTVTFYKNSSSQGTINLNSGSAATGYHFGATVRGAAVNFTPNFGQRPFAYTPPTGFKALNTQNLPDSTIKKGNQYFDVVTRNGFGSSGGSVSSLKFQPDFIWDKRRNSASSHWLWDSIRGVSQYLHSESTAAEGTLSTLLLSFDSNGFTLGSSDWATTDTAVDWAWKAGGTAVSNTAGSITSSVSANTTSGFSIVTWAGTSINASTIGHGLGVAPKMIITKSRSNASSWVVGIGGISGFGVNDYLVLQTTGAKGSSSTFYQAYGSSTFTVGVSAADEMNKTGNNYVSYCFAEVPGFSRFGSYTGNGSADGPFVFCGFRPRYIMIKESSSTGSWILLDTSRSPYNVSNNASLWANLSDAEGGAAAYLDILSNGFKIRDTDSDKNTSSQTYIFAAFAEFPFRNSLAR